MSKHILNVIQMGCTQRCSKHILNEQASMYNSDVAKAQINFIGWDAHTEILKIN